LAGMMLGQWCAADLDRFEITGGREPPPPRLQRRLSAASELFHASLGELEPLAAAMQAPQVEEQFLALGIYDAVMRLRLEAQYGLARCQLHRASLLAGGADTSAPASAADDAVGGAGRSGAA